LIAEDLWDASAVHGARCQLHGFLGHAGTAAVLSLASILIPSKGHSLLAASLPLWLTIVDSSSSSAPLHISLLLFLSFRESLHIVTRISELSNEQLLSYGFILGLSLPRNDILPAIGLNHMLHVPEVLLLLFLFFLQFLFDFGKPGVDLFLL
jgi:hypothetical protein